ncbi:hypothetical protein BC830DRAFT_1173227 [Chytriomyces sp. MP71]|nr:hypothetical protein BC830DRAFT_1173227 [Chytriomyces sp. MP71]
MSLGQSSPRADLDSGFLPSHSPEPGGSAIDAVAAKADHREAGQKGGVGGFLSNLMPIWAMHESNIHPSDASLYDHDQGQDVAKRDGNLWQAVWTGNLEDVKRYAQEPYTKGIVAADGKELSGAPRLRGEYERSAHGETILHVACLINDKSLVHWIVKRFPLLVNARYLKAMYNGETSLHIAVVNSQPHDYSLVKFLVDHGAEISGPHVAGTEFLKEEHSGCIYFGSSVLHFAVSTGKSDLAHYLVMKSRELLKSGNIDILTEVDIYGNNAMHLWAYHGAIDLRLYRFLRDQNKADLRANRTKIDLTKARNKDKLTPFQVGIARGHMNVIEAIKEPLWEFGLVKAYKVPLDELEPLQPHYEKKDRLKSGLLQAKTLGRVSASALEIATTREDKKIVCHPLMDSVVKIKWALYGRRHFLRQLSLTFFMIFSFTVAISMQPSSMEDRQMYIASNTNPAPVVRLVFEAFTLLCTLRVASGEFGEVRVQGFSYFYGVGSGENAIQWLFCLFVWLVPIMRWGIAAPYEGEDSRLVTIRDVENVLWGLGAIMGWAYVVTFGKGFASIGPLIQVVKKMILKDFLRWLALYTCLTVGTASCLFLQMQEVPYTKPEINSKSIPGTNETVDVIIPADWNQFAGSVLWTIRYNFTFRVFLSDNSEISFVFMQAFFDHFRMTRTAWFTEAVYIAYGFVVLLILFNMLIASLAETFKEVNRDHSREWKVQFADMLIQIDAKLTDAEHRHILTHIGWTDEPLSEQVTSRYLVFTERTRNFPNRSSEKEKTVVEIANIVVARDDQGRQVKIRTTGHKHWTGWGEDILHGLNALNHFDVHTLKKKEKRHAEMWDRSRMRCHHVEETTRAQYVQRVARQQLACHLGMDEQELVEDYEYR